MLVKNKRPCLITITHAGATYSLMPSGCSGDTKELPDSAYGLHFVQSLMDAGQVEVNIDPKKIAQEPESSDVEKSELIAKCQSAGIPANSRWSIKRMIEALGNANNG